MSQYHLFYVDRPQNRFVLDSARLSIGSGADADIRMDVPGLYAEAIFIDDRLTILESSMPIRIDGRWLNDYPVDVTARQVVSFSDAEHLVFTAVDDEEPVVLPALESLKAETNGVPWKERLPILGRFLAATIGTITLILIVAITSASLKEEEPLNVDPQPELQHRQPHDMRLYTQDTLGKALIAYEKTDKTVTITSFEVAKTTKEDLLRVLQHYEPQVQVIWKVIRPEEVVQRVNGTLAKINGATGLKAHYEHQVVTVSGGVLSTHQEAVAKQVQQLSVAPFTLKYQPDMIKADIKVLALSIGQYQASVTLRWNNQTLQLAESQQIPQLGSIRLIKHDGIIVATRHGDVFIPLS